MTRGQASCRAERGRAPQTSEASLSATDRTLLTRRRALAAVGGLAGVSSAGCIGLRSASGGGDGISGAIDITGSSTVFPLVSAIAEEFQAEHPDVDMNMSSTGSGGGFADHFCPGSSDFNNASREIREPEVEQCRDSGVEFVELKVATDALTVIVNNDADFVDCLTVEELAQIWGPDAATRWSEVREGFPDERIERYGAAETSGTFDYFTETVVGEAGAHTEDYQATEHDNTILQGVRGDRYAIGYFGFSYYYSNPEEVTALGVDGGDGCVEPTLETAAQGEYVPLSRPLFTYVSRSSLEEEHVERFATYLLLQSTNEQIVAEDVGYVPNTPEEMGVQLDRLMRAVRGDPA